MPKLVRNGVEYGGGSGYTKKQIDDKLDTKQEVIDGNNKLSADLVDDTSSTNKLVHIDNAGGLWVGSTQYIKIMDSASYEALTTKDDMIYMVYPTPPVNLSMSASPRVVETPETSTEQEEIQNNQRSEYILDDDEPMAMRGGER